jgi:hypothetical protein
MMKYQIENCFGKYVIHKTGDDVPGKFGLYLSKVKKDGFSGMVYAWKGVEDWQINDIAAAIMYNNGTPDTITDDQIAVLEYTGWLD